MPRTSDWSLVASLLNTPDWIFVRPTREIQTQDELHEAARRRIARSGRGKLTPYAGWHHQQHAFGADGTLNAFQFVYWGGDRDEVRRRLERLVPHGFLILGGQNREVPFLLVRDVETPPTVEAAHADRIRARLQLVGNPTLQQHGAPRPTAADLRLSHEVLAAVEAQRLPEDLATEAARVLHDCADLSDGEIGVLAMIGRAWPELLEAWDDPRALSMLEEQFLARGGELSLRAYLRVGQRRGAEPSQLLIAVAERLRSAPAGRRREARIGTVLMLLASERGRRPASILKVLADEGLPPWLRAEAAEYGKGIFLDLQRRASAAGTGEPWPTNREAIERFLREWGPAADRFYAGINVRTTNGLTVREQIERRWDARELVDLDDEGAHLLRAELCEPNMGEPELAVILEMLLTTGNLRVEDVAPLRTGWRKRLLRRPAPRSRARPAVVSVADVLLRAGDPLGTTITEAIRSDKRKWTAKHKMLIEAILAELGDDDALRCLATSASESVVGAIAHVQAVSRRDRNDTAVAAGALWREAEPTPRYRRLYYGWAALALYTNPQQPEWDLGTVIRVSRHERAARALARDPRLPQDFRDWVHQRATE